MFWKESIYERIVDKIIYLDTENFSSLISLFHQKRLIVLQIKTKLKMEMYIKLLTGQCSLVLYLRSVFGSLSLSLLVSYYQLCVQNSVFKEKLVLKFCSGLGKIKYRISRSVDKICCSSFAKCCSFLSIDTSHLFKVV